MDADRAAGDRNPAVSGSGTQFRRSRFRHRSVWCTRNTIEPRLDPASQLPHHEFLALDRRKDVRGAGDVLLSQASGKVHIARYRLD